MPQPHLPPNLFFLLHSWNLTVRPWKMMLGRLLSFFGFGPIFRGYVKLRGCTVHGVTYHWPKKTGRPKHRNPRTGSKLKLHVLQLHKKCFVAWANEHVRADVASWFAWTFVESLEKHCRNKQKRSSSTNMCTQMHVFSIMPLITAEVVFSSLSMFCRKSWSCYVEINMGSTWSNQTEVDTDNIRNNNTIYVYIGPPEKYIVMFFFCF